MITIDLSILNQKGTPMFYSDIFADRPPFGIAGRIFISTDTKEFYRDTGTSWELLAGPGGGTITGSGTATQVAFFNSSSSITGNNDLWWDNSNSRLGIGNNNPATNLDIHGNNATIQIDGRSTSSAFVQFVTQGVSKWRIGNLSPSNYFQIYDNSNSLERIKLENTGLLTLTGNMTNVLTQTATGGSGWYGIFSNENITIPASTTFSGGNSFSSINGKNGMTFAGSATFGLDNVPSGILSTNILSFSSAGSTITINQAGGVRAMSAITAFNQINSTNNGTISHIAGLQVIAPYSGAGTLTATNYYGLLLNASNERTAFTITNSWGIYQEGNVDKNYFNGTTLIGTNVDNLTGAKLQVSGLATFSLSISAAQFNSTSSTAATPAFAVSSNNGMYNGGANTIGWAINGNQAMTLDASGRLGIGTATPSQKLSVDGGASSIYIQVVGQSRNMYLGQDTTGASIYSDGAVPMYFSTNGTEKMRITSSGNVGIGTASPSGTGWNTNSLAVQAYKNDTDGALFRATSSNTDFVFSAGNDIGYIATLGADPIAFYTNLTERLRITSGGRVLIGTTTDNTIDLLQVAGSGSFSTSGTTTIRVKGSSNTGFDLQNDNGGAYVWNRDNLPMYFATNNTERMRINAAGGIEMKDSLKLTNFTTSGTAGSIVNYVQITVGTTNYLLPLYNLP